MKRIVPRRLASAIQRSAVSSKSTALVRSSVERTAREMSETMTMAPMKKAAILMPSGRSMTLATVV